MKFPLVQGPRIPLPLDHLFKSKIRPYRTNPTKTHLELLRVTWMHSNVRAKPPKLLVLLNLISFPSVMKIVNISE